MINAGVAVNLVIGPVIVVIEMEIHIEEDLKVVQEVVHHDEVDVAIVVIVEEEMMVVLKN
jgi:hypothetical protein